MGYRDVWRRRDHACRIWSHRLTRRRPPVARLTHLAGHFVGTPGRPEHATRSRSRPFPRLRAAAAFLGNRFITSSPPTGSRSSARARRMSSQSSRRVIFAMSACLPPRLSGCRSLLRSSNPRAALFTQLDSLGHADLESGESGIRVSYAPSSPRSSGLWASSGAPRSNIAAM